VTASLDNLSFTAAARFPNAAMYDAFRRSVAADDVSYFRPVSADGKEYDQWFTDFTTNQVDGPTNVGIYSLGVAPHAADPMTASGKPKPFFAWEHSGKPGV